MSTTSGAPVTSTLAKGSAILRSGVCDRIPVTFFSTRGCRYVRWIQVGMPRINRDIVDSVFFLYKAKDDAEAGKNAEGTGFFVRYEGFYYAVSNRHVVMDGGASVVRINAKVGVDVLEFDPADWHACPSGDDVAVVQVDIDPETHVARAVPSAMFVRQDIPNIGIGDDVFMLGLFVDHEGRDQNNPMARFGNVSLLPSKNSPIPSDHGAHPGYVCDMHSRSGYSGSPVFMYRTIGGDLTREDSVIFRSSDLARLLWMERINHDITVQAEIFAQPVFQLLGVHWGHFREEWKIERGIGAEESVTGFSGLSCVAPAWKILETLNIPALVEQRRRLQGARNTVNDSGST